VLARIGQASMPTAYAQCRTRTRITSKWWLSPVSSSRWSKQCYLKWRHT